MKQQIELLTDMVREKKDPASILILEVLSEMDHKLQAQGEEIIRIREVLGKMPYSGGANTSGLSIG